MRARRPKPFKLDDPRLALAVQGKLCQKWSPQQISLYLAGEHGDEAAMQVSHETIYQALFVQGRGQLRAELHRHLRTGRAWRRPRGLSGANKSKIPGMVSISEWVTEQRSVRQRLHVWAPPVFTERTSVGLDVHPRSVLAAVIDGITGEVFRPRLTPSNEPVISCG